MMMVNNMPLEPMKLRIRDEDYLRLVIRDEVTKANGKQIEGLKDVFVTAHQCANQRAEKKRLELAVEDNKWVKYGKSTTKWSAVILGISAIVTFISECISRLT
jgi:hypothetical protein